MAGIGLEYEEDRVNRFLVLKDYPLPSSLYNVDQCDVLIFIPPNYNAAGNDMFWTHPALSRLDQKLIPNIEKTGGGDNRQYGGKEFCRWSRHWSEASAWQPNIDNVQTILLRIEWAFRNPDAKK